MANEMSYTHATPGGRLSRPFRAHLSRYKGPDEITRMNDFVTFGDAAAIVDTVKENAVYIVGALVVGIGAWWYYSG